jgi:hypothetical protein
VRVTKAALDDAVHAHPAPAVTVRKAVPPVPATLSVVLETLYVQVGVGAVGDVDSAFFEHALAATNETTAIRHDSLRTIPPAIERI